ncbi:hypothetical protein GCM10023318_28440 [Nocardia callitridis]|uniref:Shikimate kinase n=1 Tax=Nocardia callitridis TaxID=648753 RepID=A0ABP9KBR9_9NOCA
MIVQTDPRVPCVVLVGPPGAGKSTIGRKLAKELGVELYDTDAAIERDTGRSIADIFATDGEPEFRAIEERVVRRALRTEPGVVSLGGGAVLSAHTRALLRDRTVVYLEISVAEGLRRTGASTARPLLNGGDPDAKYRELMRKRRPLYREVATVKLRTDGRSPGRVVRMVMDKLSLESAPVADTEPSADTVAADATPAKPSGSGRSRARRRARARAAARRAAAEESGTPQKGQAGHSQPAKPSSTAAAPAPGTDADAAAPSGRTPRRRPRRSRARKPTKPTGSEQT